MNEIRAELDGRLEHIRQELIAMVDLLISRIDEVTSALLERDVAKADLLILADDEMDLMSQQVEDLCIDTLVREQPVAVDLRSIVAAIHMNSDVERSGDLTTNIAKAVGRLQGTQPGDRIRDLILRMAEQAKVLFVRSKDAYLQLDLELAMSIDELDDVLDDLHRTFIQTVIHESRQGDLVAHQTLQLAMIGRFYERIGDHAENLGERIRYIIDGWTPEREGASRATAKSDLVPEGSAPSRGLALIDTATDGRRIDAMRRDFVANVSHELKTPIGAISLLAETLADCGPESDRDRLTLHLNREIKRVESIIDDLLELTRLEEFDYPPERLSIDNVVHEAADVTRGLADARGISLAILGVPSGVEIDGEARQIVRALVNLIDNAVRYSDTESQVTVEVQPVHDGVDIVVTDTGAGIPRPELERIFERFYRVDPARSRETGGTGLGLSIVRHVADNYGGRVLVESKVGSGSAFTFHLPIPNEVPETEPAAVDSTTESSASGQP